MYDVLYSIARSLANYQSFEDGNQVNPSRWQSAIGMASNMISGKVKATIGRTHRGYKQASRSKNLEHRSIFPGGCTYNTFGKKQVIYIYRLLKTGSSLCVQSKINMKKRPRSVISK